jgi:hypothetical protein
MVSLWKTILVPPVFPPHAALANPSDVVPPAPTHTVSDECPLARAASNITESRPVSPTLLYEDASDNGYTMRDHDRDLSRGMGNHLRWPHTSPSVSKRHRSNGTVMHQSPVVSLDVSTEPTVPLPPALPSGSSEPLRRSGRVRRNDLPCPAPSSISTNPRVPVKQRWYYEKTSPTLTDATLNLAASTTVGDDVVPHTEDSSFAQRGILLAHHCDAHNCSPSTHLGGMSPAELVYGPHLRGVSSYDLPPVVPDSISSQTADPFLQAEVTTFVQQLASTNLLLKPRQPWMLEGDSRSDAAADRDWHLASSRLFGTSSHAVQPLSVTPDLLSSMGTTASAFPPLVRMDIASAYLPKGNQETVSSETSESGSFPHAFAPINNKTIRRIFAARETIFKYGIYLPRNDRDADASPERARWNSGRQLEWLRLKEVNAFEYDWTKERLTRDYPHYLHADIGHLFYIYDYKFSGEHRVRLVFDGSRQSATTYDDTFSPTVRPESIRLFHIYSVEMGWEIRQFDVPQAFLQSPVDHDIFVYPPRTNIEFPGQVLKLRLALYGAKQSAALFYKLLNGFLLSLGFVSSPMDACFYKRVDALVIVHVDDMRVSGSPLTVASIHAALFQRFKITTSDGLRFLGMDTQYDVAAGVLTMGMDTYIQSTMERFSKFDLTLGFPYREIVGCLLWIVLCVVGPELVRVKDLAKRSTAPTLSDYNDAFKVLKRVYKRRSAVIMFKRGFAGRELKPSQTRPEINVNVLLSTEISATPPALPEYFSQSDLLAYFSGPQRDLDIATPPLPISTQFSLVAYTDASFGVGDEKVSISGYVIFVNGTPILWGSQRQTTIADSTCSAEFVAASVCCKQVMNVENMFRFLGVLCPKPYPLYTDSQASLSIASNSDRMGKIRHIAIRYHLVRCMALQGDVILLFCVTEDMVADLLTKILSGAPFDRLAARFYFLGVEKM